MSAPVAELSRRYRFSAQHRLHSAALSDAENRATFGKCNNPYGHGHNYVVQVTLRGPVDAMTGMVTNLADLDAFAKRELIERFDHTNLDLNPIFGGKVTTTENLAVVIWSLFKAYPHAKLVRVRVEETGNNAFDYYGDATARMS